jgi:hypothetical protein
LSELARLPSTNGALSHSEQKKQQLAFKLLFFFERARPFAIYQRRPFTLKIVFSRSSEVSPRVVIGVHVGEDADIKTIIQRSD